MRTANVVINQAIAENRVPEYLLYVFSGLFVITGEILIGYALFHGSTITAVAGVALNGLAWPAFSATRDIRSENLMLRMLEVPLTKVKTAKEAAEMLTEVFRSNFKHAASNKEEKKRQGTEKSVSA